MSLLHGYSSDEDDAMGNHGDDAFGLSALTTSKKARVDTQVASNIETSAPDVLAEVCVSSKICVNGFSQVNYHVGPIEANVAHHSTFRHADERQCSL